MRAIICVVLVLALVGPLSAIAADPVAQTYNAPSDRVWTVVEAVLKQLGWDIDKRDRGIGMLTTDSRSLDGGNYGVYAKGVRHRLTLYVKAASDNRTTVTIERAVFKRERILWIDKDEPVGDATAKKGEVEKAVLAAIGRAL
jgi:hypothetical protein